MVNNLERGWFAVFTAAAPIKIRITHQGITMHTRMRKRTPYADQVGAIVSTRLPDNVDRMIHRMAVITMRSKSDIVRSIIVAHLIAAGHLEPLSIEAFRPPA